MLQSHSMWYRWHMWISLKAKPCTKVLDTIISLNILLTDVQQLAYSQTDRESNIFSEILESKIYQKMLNNICSTVGLFTNRSSIWIGVLGLSSWAWSRTLLTCTPWRSCPTFWRNWTRGRSSRSRSMKLTSSRPWRVLHWKIE